MSQKIIYSRVRIPLIRTMINMLRHISFLSGKYLNKFNILSIYIINMMFHYKQISFQFNMNYYLLFPLSMFLLISMVSLDFFNISYAQNLTNSISLKANAGEDQYVEEGKPVILNAEDSVSSDPPIDAFKWFQVEPKDPLIDLENSNTSRASFTSPNLPSDGYFIFQLIVKDEEITDTDTVNIYVVEDLSENSFQSGNIEYQPEVCFDGVDNDLDGKIDLQDEECGLSGNQGRPNNQQPLPPGGNPYNPFSGRGVPDQGQPNSGRLGEGPLDPNPRPQQDPNLLPGTQGLR